MMGRLPAGQNELFYEFNLEKRVPEHHLLRELDRFLDFGPVRRRLRSHYSHTGRPSVDPELMLRMVIIGYCYGIRSARQLCEEVDLNLAYRWFCRLGLEGDVPDHSTLSVNRTGRFRDSELFDFVFESVVQRCIDEGLVGGEGFAVDASLIKADAHRARGYPGKEGIDWQRPTRKTRAVREYLQGLDYDAEQVRAHETKHRAISLTDPASSWTSALGGPAYFAYSTNYLIDVDNAVILSVEACPSSLSKEAHAARVMLEHTEKRFGLKPLYLTADTAYGTAQMLGWLTGKKQIIPYVPVRDRTQGKPGHFGVSAFVWDEATDSYTCPAGHTLQRPQRQYRRSPTKRSKNKDDTITYRASKHRCDSCSLKPRCCPGRASRKIARSIYEDAREFARKLAPTDAYARSRNERKKVEMLFAHLKKNMRFDRLRLRGPTGARDEFVLAATVQNLRKLAKLVRTPAQPSLAVT